MKKNYWYIVCWIMMTISITGCFSPKGIQYFTEYKHNQDSFEVAEKEPVRIRPNDQLYITVKSYNEYDANMLSASSNEVRMSSGQSMHLIGYNVDEKGFINYPIAGMVKVEGMTLHEAEEVIEKKLEGFLNTPNVAMKFLNKTFTVLGEVNQPGQFEYYKDHINIFQALGLARDLTEAGNREEIIIFRQKDETLEKAIINLKNQDLLLSDYYYIRPNDIIYVKPTAVRRWRLISGTYGLLLSTTTTLIVILDRINW